jgi:hypothetical protein
MSHRTHFARSIARHLRRWLPGADGIAGAAAANGDPSALLDLQTDPHHRPHPAGSE